MDIKITKKRLSNLISYDFLKIIIASLAAFVVWSLAFTSLGTRITDGQKFYLVVYEGVYGNENLTFFQKLKQKGNGVNGESVLSYDVLETEVTDIRSVGSYTASYMMNLRMSVNEGDAIIIGGGDIPFDEETGVGSDVQSLVTNHVLVSVDKLLDSAYIYTVRNGFITETEDGYKVNEDKIEEYFRTKRVNSERNYRRTYTDEQKISEGVKNEIKRIEAVYLNFKSVKGAIERAKEKGEDFLWYSRSAFKDNDEIVYGETGAFGIDISKLTAHSSENKPDIKSLWYTLDENGKTTVDGLVFGVTDLFSVQSDLQYEGLAVMNYIIRTYSDYAD